MFAQEAECRDDSELSHLLALAGQAGVAHLVESRPDEADEQRSHRLAVLFGRAGDARECDCHIGTEPVTNAMRHLARRGLADHGTVADTQERSFDVGRIADDRATEHVAGAGDARQPGSDDWAPRP